ncbi:MAG: AbrB/MazE/SpoVT family DNA-binding domain-containing protein, partial [Gammaproteobacteria bacterium]
RVCTGADVATAKLTSKGQITLPKLIRDHLGLRTGDRVEFLVSPDESVTILPAVRDVQELKGMIPKPEQPVSIDDMNAAIQEAGSRKR